ncbi:transposase [Streptomyces morookaense]|uniref:transposase n=1 Tax=Streptomyces morookaense TaxID=1970 RepID=UPI00341081A6
MRARFPAPDHPHRPCQTSRKDHQPGTGDRRLLRQHTLRRRLGPAPGRLSRRADSVSWWEAQSHRGTLVTRVRFTERHCGPCELRTSCTHAKTGRNLTLGPRVEHDILQQARVEQDTDLWRHRYGHRAGVEGIISQGVQAFGLRGS